MNLTPLLDGPASSGQAILHSRTRRAQRQQAALAQGCTSLVSFTLNLPGPIKQFPLAAFSFEAGLEALDALFSTTLLGREVFAPQDTGDEALYRLSLPPEAVKERCIALEEAHPLGRLFDLDVLGSDGIPISRSQFGRPPRPCLLCGGEAKLCARMQRHSQEELRQVVGQTMYRYFSARRADSYTACITRAMLYEVSVTPKPGLVDRSNSGAHTDMDFFTFLDSASTLAPHFRDMFAAGWREPDQAPESLFRHLQVLGLLSEQDMLTATQGVNTHRGLIFSFGILCAALGRTAAQNLGAPPSLPDVLASCKALGTCSLDGLSAQGPQSHGQFCYQAYRAFGARGQAAAGFPDAVEIALPALHRWTAQGLSLNDASALALLALLANTEDTNLLFRGGAERARAARLQAEELLEQASRDDILPLLEALDRQYIAQRLSPGGCADLLAVALALFFLLQQGLVTP